MARLFHILISIFFFICVGKFSTSSDVNNEEKKVYIAYMGSLPKGKYSPTEHHQQLLQEVVDSSDPGERLVTSYTRSFNGFAAYLTEQEQQKLASYDDVVSVFPSKTLKLQTTNSWNFIGFPQNVARNPGVESDTIIGVMDTGIWPESASFSDTNVGPIPRKWKGVCQGGPNFKCNRKIIGARYYHFSRTARDLHGHGTHCASVAAGNIIRDASYYGIGQGVARGGVPLARIAVYKVCTDNYSECDEHDIVKAFDDAIADGVDIISISISLPSPEPTKDDGVARGSFHAMLKNVLTVNSAGNNGYSEGSTSSVAPWLLTVGASTTDHKIITKISLGNGKVYYGNTVNSFGLNGRNLPIIYGKNASRSCTEEQARQCDQFCLGKNLVQGKIVLCSHYVGIHEAARTEAQGSIAETNIDYDTTSNVVPCAASSVTSHQFAEVQSYVLSSPSPQATIFKSEIVHDQYAPYVAAFSSRGPNTINPDILKPDIVAPGVSILAAFSPEGSPSGNPDIDRRHINYNFLSGTSMAAPHVAGAAAYIKTFHPTWSHSAIKSALMTAASQLNPNQSIYGDAEFSYGAGNLNPRAALDPGLVYETHNEDYIAMSCGLDYYHSSVVSKIFGENITCSGLNSARPKDLNLPTMTAQVATQGFSFQFPRTVTNVGQASSTYRATIKNTFPCNITVVPNVLSFRALNERKSFVVTVTGRRVDSMMSASLVWSDGRHNVRSPIVVYPKH